MHMLRARGTSATRTSTPEGTERRTARIDVVEHTAVFLDGVVDPTLRAVLQEWDETFAIPVLDAAPDRAADGDGDAVRGVEFVTQVLGAPAADVLEAASINERTYYSWKQHGRRPRLASVGRLWAVVQAAESLDASGEPARAWFRRDPENRELLRAGRLDDLLRRFSDERIRATGRVAAPAVAANAVGQEVVPEREHGQRVSRRAPVTPRRLTR